MEFHSNIPAEVIAAYVAGLSAYVRDLTPILFVAALRDFEPDKDGAAERNEPPPRMLTLKEAADILGTTFYTVRRLVRAGRLPGHKVGQQWRVPMAAVKALAEVGED